jgi:hypothetical protein
VAAVRFLILAVALAVEVEAASTEAEAEAVIDNRISGQQKAACSPGRLFIVSRICFTSP